MHIIIDFALLLIVTVPIVVAARRGFVKSISGAASLVVAIAVAFVATGYLVNAVDNNGYKKKLEDKLAGTLADISGSDEEAENDINDEKSELSRYLTGIGIDTDDIKAKLEDGKSSAINSIAGIAAAKISDKLVYFLCFAVLFAASYIISVIVFWIISKLVKLPPLKHFDKLLGALLGLATALVFSVVFVSLVKTAIPYFQSVYPDTFSKTVLEDTFIFKYAEQYVPAIK